MNKKIIVTLISSILIIVFLITIYFGFKYSRGKPIEYVEPKRAVLEVPYLEREIDLSKGISPEIWESLPGRNVEMMFQVTVLPWPKSSVSTLTVKTYHNRKDIYFHLTWKDDTENRNLKMKIFPDACAIMFPIEAETQPASIMMGFLNQANIWQWKASQDQEYWEGEQSSKKTYIDFYYPFEEKELFGVSKNVANTSANDLTAIRVGTVTPKENQNLQGRGVWENGSWHVVFKRSLKAEDSEVDAAFEPAKSLYCSFGVWNGENEDRGGRKSISEWVELKVQEKIPGH